MISRFNDLSNSAICQVLHLSLTISCRGRNSVI
jgi:hypothetical protein